MNSKFAIFIKCDGLCWNCYNDNTNTQALLHGPIKCRIKIENNVTACRKWLIRSRTNKKFVFANSWQASGDRNKTILLVQRALLYVLACAHKRIEYQNAANGKRESHLHNLYKIQRKRYFNEYMHHERNWVELNAMGVNEAHGGGTGWSAEFACEFVSTYVQ